MDPTWLASLFGPEALDTSQFTGGVVPPNPTFDDRFNNLLPFTGPTVGVGGQSVTPPITPSAAPVAPTGADVPNPPPAPAAPPAMPPAVAPAPSSTAGLYAAAKPGEADPSRILQALRGVQAPPPPVAQKIATPHPLQPHAIAPGNLVNLLTSLGIGPGQLPQLSRMVGR